MFKRPRLACAALSMLALTITVSGADVRAQGRHGAITVPGNPLPLPIIPVHSTPPASAPVVKTGETMAPAKGNTGAPGETAKVHTGDVGDSAKERPADIGDAAKARAGETGDAAKARAGEAGNGVKAGAAAATTTATIKAGAEVADNTKERGTEVSADIVRLRAQRLSQANELLRQHRDVLEPDPRGAPIVKRELLAWSPSHVALALAEIEGLTVLRKTRLAGFGQTLVVLGVPAEMATADMLQRLRALDPAGSYDFNNVYTGSAAAPMAKAKAKTKPRAKAVPETAAKTRPDAAKVGLVDGGVDAGHVAMRGAAITRWGCAGAAVPSAHGTAVAALMVGQAPAFHGVLPGAHLYAADVYCGDATGGSAEKIAAALAWFAQEKIGVVNLSLVGPPNQTLEHAVAAMVKRGHLLVAAVGNDGPAAPPLYPASYPGVVGVSAVDKDGHCLPEAGRGAQVMFAAPGSNMVSAAAGAPPFQAVRGTSFAAPIVAALLAPALAQPDTLGAKHALAALARQAGRGRQAPPSTETGYGIVGAAYRIDPASVH
jgi:hypothetical protein